MIVTGIVIVIVTGSLTKYVSMEYLKGSYSTSNTQATSLRDFLWLWLVIVIVI